MNAVKTFAALALTTAVCFGFSSTSMAGAIQACSEPAPGGDLACGTFLGTGSSLDTLGSGGNPLDPLYWDGGSLFGDSESGFTQYNQISKWDDGDGWSGADGSLIVNGWNSDSKPLWGTWSTSFAVDLVVLKGSTDHAIYAVDGATSGDWSVYWGMPKPGNSPNPAALSNISFYSATPVSSVPTPSALGLLGLGLLLVASGKRLRSVRSARAA